MTAQIMEHPFLAFGTKVNIKPNDKTEKMDDFLATLAIALLLYFLYLCFLFTKNFFPILSGMAYFNKLYPIKYKEVFINKYLFNTEGVVWMSAAINGREQDFVKAVVADVDPEFLTLEIADSDAEICIPLGRILYSSELPTALMT